MFITVKYGGRFNSLRQDLLLWHLLLKFKSSNHAPISVLKTSNSAVIVVYI